MTVGSDQHRRRSCDLAKDREFPHPIVLGVDEADSIAPGRDVEAAGLAEVEEHRSGVVHEGEHARGTVLGSQVEVGHAPTEERVPLSEVVADVETADIRGDATAGLVHRQDFGEEVAESLVTVARAAERDLRHRVVQHPGTDRMPFGVVRVEEALG